MNPSAGVAAVAMSITTTARPTGGRLLLPAPAAVAAIVINYCIAT
jgi:hypothetical protein